MDFSGNYGQRPPRPPMVGQYGPPQTGSGQAPGQPSTQNPFGMKSKGRSPYSKTNVFARPNGPPGTQPLGPRPFGGPPGGDPRMQHPSGTFPQQFQPPPTSGSLSWPGSPDGDNRMQQSHTSLPPSFSQPTMQPAASLFTPQLNGSFDQTIPQASQNSQSVDHITSSFNTHSTQNMNSVNSAFNTQGNPNADNVQSAFTTQGNPGVDNFNSAFTTQGNPGVDNFNSAFTAQGNPNVDNVNSAFNRLTLDPPSVSGITMQTPQRVLEKQGYEEDHDDSVDESDEISSDADTDDDDLSSDDPSSDELAQTGDSQRTAGLIRQATLLQKAAAQLDQETQNIPKHGLGNNQSGHPPQMTAPPQSTEQVISQWTPQDFQDVGLPTTSQYQQVRPQDQVHETYTGHAQVPMVAPTSEASFKSDGNQAGIMDSFSQLNNSNKFVASSFPANSSQMNPHFHSTNPTNAVSKTSDLITDSFSSQQPLDLFGGSNTASNMFPVDGAAGRSHQGLTQDSFNTSVDGQNVQGHGQSAQGHGQRFPGHEQSVPEYGQNVPGHGQNVLGHQQNMPDHEKSVVGHGQSIPGHGHPSAFRAVKPKQGNEQSSFASFSSDSIDQQMKSEFPQSGANREDGTNKAGTARIPTVPAAQSQEVSSFPPAKNYISNASQPERYSEEQSSLVLDPRPHDHDPNNSQSPFPPDHHVRRDYPHAHGMELSHDRHRSRGSQDSLVSPKQQMAAPFPSQQPVSSSGLTNYTEESISSASTESSSKSVIDNRQHVPLATDNTGQNAGYQDSGSWGVSSKDPMQDVDFNPQNQSSPAHTVKQVRNVPEQAIADAKQGYPNEAMLMHPNTSHNGGPTSQDQQWYQANARDDRQGHRDQRGHMPSQQHQDYRNPDHILAQVNANPSRENDFRTEINAAHSAGRGMFQLGEQDNYSGESQLQKGPQNFGEPSNNYQSSVQPQPFDSNRNVEQNEPLGAKHKGHESKAPANSFGIKLFGQNIPQQANNQPGQHVERTDLNPRTGVDRNALHSEIPQMTSNDLGQSTFPNEVPVQPPAQLEQNLSQHINSAPQDLRGFRNESQPQQMSGVQQMSHSRQEPYSNDIQQPPAFQKYPSQEKQIEPASRSKVSSQPSERQISSEGFQERNIPHHFQQQPGQQSKNAPQPNLVAQEQPSQRQMVTQNDQYEQVHRNEKPFPKHQISEQSQPMAQQRDGNSQQFEGHSAPQQSNSLQQQYSHRSRSGPSSLERNNRLSDLGLQKAPAQAHLPHTHQGQPQLAEGSSSQQQLQEPSNQLATSHNQFMQGQQAGPHGITGQGQMQDLMQAHHGINQPAVPQNQARQNQPMRDSQPTSQRLETNQPTGQQVTADGRLSQPDQLQIAGQAQQPLSQYQPAQSSQQTYPQQQKQQQSFPQQQEQQLNMQYPQQKQQQNFPLQQQQQNLPLQQQQQNLPPQNQKQNLPPQQQQNLPQQQQQQAIPQQQLQQQQYPHQQFPQQQPQSQQYPQQQQGYNQQYPNQQQQQQNSLPPQQLQQQQYPHQQQQTAQQQQQQIQQQGQFPQQQYGQHGAQYYGHQHSQGDPSQRFDNMSPALPMQQQMPNYPDQNQMQGWNAQYGGYPQNYNYEYYNWYWANYGYGGYPQYPGAYPGWDARSHHSDQMSYSSSRNPSEVDVDSRPSSVIDNRPMDDYEIESLEMSKKEISTFERTSPVEIERLTPVHFYKPHLTARFSLIGTCVITDPNDPNEDQIPSILCVPNRNLYAFADLQDYPGPLIRGETSKRSVINFAIKKAQKWLSNTEMKKEHCESLSLLWKYVAMLIKHNGVKDGPDAAEMLMQHKSNVDPGQREADLLGLETLATSVSSSKTLALQQYRDHLLQGSWRDALEFAVDNDLWGHALTLSYKMDHKLHSAVMNRLIASLDDKDSLVSLYGHLSGRGLPAQSCHALRSGNADWREHLAMLIANPTKHEDRNKKNVITLGDTLREQGNIGAAHLCYLLADVHISKFNDKATKICLLGVDHKSVDHPSRPDLWATNEFVQLTEMYEYANRLQSKDACIPAFQSFKLIYVNRLSEAGMLKEAYSYCEEIAFVVLKDPRSYDGTFLNLFSKTCERLHYQSLESHDDPEPEWYSKIVELRDRKLTDPHCSNETERERDYVPSIPSSQTPESDYRGTPSQDSQDYNPESRASVEPPLENHQEAPGPVQEDSRSQWPEQQADTHAQTQGENAQWQTQNANAQWQNQDGATQWQNQDGNAQWQNEDPNNQLQRQQSQEQPGQQDQTDGTQEVYQQNSGLQQQEYPNTQQTGQQAWNQNYQQWDQQNEWAGNNGQFQPNPAEVGEDVAENSQYQNNQTGQGDTYQSQQPSQFFNPADFGGQQDYNQPNPNMGFGYPNDGQVAGGYGNDQNQSTSTEQTSQEEPPAEDDFYGHFASRAKEKGKEKAKSDTADGKPDESSKKSSASKDSAGQQKSGWIGSLTSMFRRRKDADLPDDKDNSIYFDKKLGKWIDKNKSEENIAPPPPPPTDTQFSSSFQASTPAENFKSLPTPAAISSPVMNRRINQSDSNLAANDEAEPQNTGPPSKFSRTAHGLGRRSNRYVSSFSGISKQDKTDSAAVPAMLNPMGMSQPAPMNFFTPPNPDAANDNAETNTVSAETHNPQVHQSQPQLHQQQEQNQGMQQQQQPQPQQRSQKQQEQQQDSSQQPQQPTFFNPMSMQQNRPSNQHRSRYPR